MEQTAVKWLEFEINRRGPTENNPPQWLKELYEQAKEMEKEQIIKARLSLDQSIHIEDALDRAEQYYNKTYKQD